MNDDNSVNDSNHTVGIKPDTGLGDQLVLALHLVATKAMLAAIRKYELKDKKPAVQTDPGHQQMNDADARRTRAGHRQDQCTG